ALQIAMIISRTRLAGMSGNSLGRFVTKVRRFIPIRGLVNVLVTTSSEMKSLSARFLGKDQATDVLSFPANGLNGLAGEIAISLEIAKENAGRLGHSTSTEIKVLIVHGMLHLAGYNHENDHGEMSREEQRLREKLRLPAGLIERNGAVVNPRRKPPRASPGRVAGSKS
ncbi:MAG: rRNA maturation RNase YbeY, partial [Terriglobales bacterium]